MVRLVSSFESVRRQALQKLERRREGTWSIVSNVKLSTAKIKQNSILQGE